jgi:16S rRNA C1402 N4-methylase RsmH
MDLGVSSMQLDQAHRGFSFMKEGPLDMRMDKGHTVTAEMLVNELSEQELGKILREYGEEKMWKMVARRIVDARCGIHAAVLGVEQEPDPQRPAHCCLGAKGGCRS